MAKVYDITKLSFLLRVLVMFDFSDHWLLSLIQCYNSSPTYLVMMNGTIEDTLNYLMSSKLGILIGISVQSLNTNGVCLELLHNDRNLVTCLTLCLYV